MSRNATRAQLAIGAGGLWLAGLSLLVIFAVLHALGLRETTTVLSGSLPAGAADPSRALRGCILYVCAYLGAVLVAPVLLLAAVLVGPARRLLRPRTRVIPADGAGKGA